MAFENCAGGIQVLELSGAGKETQEGASNVRFLDDGLCFLHPSMSAKNNVSEIGRASCRERVL